MDVPRQAANVGPDRIVSSLLESVQDGIHVISPTCEQEVCADTQSAVILVGQFVPATLSQCPTSFPVSGWEVVVWIVRANPFGEALLPTGIHEQVRGMMGGRQL